MRLLNGVFESRRSLRSRYQIAEELVGYFPVAEFPDYDAFLAAGGSCLKRERRTVVTVVRRALQGLPTGEFSSFVIKVYRYPSFFPRLRTGFQLSKAEREFNSLRYLSEHGVGAAQAVGVGIERDWFGLVRSCFIITRWVDRSTNLSQWSTEPNLQEKLDEKRVDEVFTQLGHMFRRLHQARFFLFTAKAKNILICNNSGRPDEICFIDLPYARTLKWRVLARWAQARDIGVLFGNVTATLSDTAIELFYRAYLPDPLGSSSKAVQRHVLRQMRAKQNRTPISRWVHDIKRRWAGKTPSAAR